jgi:hypothetical protein
MLWGIVVGLLQAATPLVFWWLDSATVLRARARRDRLGLRRLRGCRRTGEGHPRRRQRDVRVRRRGRRGGHGITPGSSWRAALRATDSSTSGSTEATSSPTRAGGRRSARSSTGSSPPSSLARSQQACTSASARVGGSQVALEQIRVPEEVRTLDEARVEALAGSIALQGMLVPVVVRAHAIALSWSPTSTHSGCASGRAGRSPLRRARRGDRGRRPRGEEHRVQAAHGLRFGEAVSDAVVDLGRHDRSLQFGRWCSARGTPA